MQYNNWKELDFNDIEDQVEYEKKKSKKQSKRKWREIEAFKDQQRERREMELNESYYSF